MKMKSKSQRFSETVFGNVDAIAGGLEAKAREYRSLCKSAGSIMRNSGLMQFLAFLQARNKHQHRALYGHLCAELENLGIVSGGGELIESVRGSSLPRYMYLTREILNLLQWHKRLAEILIRVGGAGEADND